MSRRYHLTRPPAPIRRARLDNLALVPGNLLRYKETWQRVANRLPEGAVLIVLPKRNPGQKATLLVVAKLLSKEGHQVRVAALEEVTREHQDRLD